MVLREIKQLFMEPDCSTNPLFAAFGNKANDALAYSAVGIIHKNIYTINPKGEIYQFESDKIWSYPKIHNNTDELFPLVQKTDDDHEEYTDEPFWKNNLSGIYESEEMNQLLK